jgi:hypothetical protein
MEREPPGGARLVDVGGLLVLDRLRDRLGTRLEARKQA